MSHKMLRPFIVKVSVLGYFPLYKLYFYKYLIIFHKCIGISIHMYFYK